MSIVRMLKTFASAALAVAASAVSAAEVISINFTQDGYGALDDATVYGNLADASITGAAWNTFSGGSGSGQATGTGTLTKYWDGTQAKSDGTAVVTYEARNMWHKSDIAAPYVGYLDDGEHNGVKGATVSVTGIPYDVYDVILYANTDQSGGRFHAFTVNGFSYSYVDGAVVKGSTADWGSAQTTLEEGKNAFRVTGLTGRLSIQGGSRDDPVRGCLAAVQIVKNTTAVVVPAMDFKYLSGQGNVIETSSANWYSDVAYATKWHWDHNAYCERIAYGRNAFCVMRANNAYPGTDVQWPNMTAFTMAFVVDVTDMTGGDDLWKVIACMGGTYNTENALVLSKDPEGGVSLRPRTLGADMDDYTLTIPASEISQGYHLFVVTCDTTGDGTLSLSMDDGAGDKTKTMTFLCQPSVGFQVGKNWNGGRPATWGYGDGLGVYAVFGWEKVLTSEQIALLYDDYADALGTPVNYSFTSDFNNGHDTGVLYIPTMTGDNALQGTRGTIEIPAKSVVTVPSVCLGNSGTAYNYTFNVRGTLNVTAASTIYNVYSEKGNKRGILFGHWAGTGVENIYGTLNAPDAWLETTFTHTTETLNIIGGTVKVRGIYARTADGIASSATISDGGTLEVAELKLDKSWPLICGAGTLRAVRYDETSTGLTDGWAVSFNDAEVGTTLDPNGLAINFAGAATGAGKIIINDTSENADGTVSFAMMSGLSGPVEVRSGTLDIKSSRPSGELSFAEGTKLRLLESVADGNGRVALNIAAGSAAPDVTMYRADGTTLLETSVETDAATGKMYIAYESDLPPVVSGEACWYDFDFENNGYTSVGSSKTTLTRDTGKGIGALTGTGAAGDFADEHSLYTSSLMYTKITYPTEWSAAIYCTLPKMKDAVLMDFGTAFGGIALIAGDTDNEVKLVMATNNTRYVPLATMTVPNATTSQHLYVFVKRDNGVDIYLDGTLWKTYSQAESIVINDGFQLGAVYGQGGNTGMHDFSYANVYNAENEEETLGILHSSYVGTLRIYDVAISEDTVNLLAKEFPYVSPNGLYTRELSGDAAWTAAGGWTKAEEGGAGTSADEPVYGSSVQLTATAASTLVIGDAESPVEIHLESLSIGGSAAVVLAPVTGTTLVNDGKTVINTSVSLPHTVSVAGGPLSLASGAALTFDYRGYDLPLGAENGAITLTGTSSADASVACLPPTDKKGRTFTLAFNESTQCWELRYARGAYTLFWREGGEAEWTSATVWGKDSPTGADAAFITGDAVVFGDVANAGSATVIAPTATLGGFMFTNQVAEAETDYVLAGGALNVPGIRDVGQGAVTVSNRLNVADGGELYVQGVVKPQEFLDVRGTLGEVRITTGESAEKRGNLTLGTEGEITIGGNLIVNANTDFTIAGTGTIRHNTEASSIYVDQSAKVRKIGSGTYSMNTPSTGDWRFSGRLEVSEGVFRIDDKFDYVTATAENPVLVNGTGKLYVYSTVNTLNRLPAGAHVLVEEQGVFEVEGNNPFRRESSDSPTVICRNGGTFRTNGANASYDVRVWDVQLDSGNLYFAGTTANYANRGLVIDGGTLHSSGESRLYGQTGSPNRLAVAEINVADGTLSCELMTDGNLVKTGAGKLILGGNNGGAYTGVVDIREGTLVMSDELLDSTVNTNITMAAGTVLEIPEDAELPFLIPDNQTWTLGGRVTIDLGNREIRSGSKILAWTEGNAPTGGRFAVKTAAGGPFSVVMRDDGAYLTIGFILKLR